MNLFNKYKQILKFTRLFKLCTLNALSKIINFKKSKWQKNFKRKSLKRLYFVLKKIRTERIKLEELKKKNFKAYKRIVKKKNLKKSLKSKKFFNFRLNFLKSKKLLTYKNIKRESGKSLRSLKYLFNNNIKLSFFNCNNNIEKKAAFIKLFISPFFKLEIFLWKLNLFSSTYLAEQYILQRKIKINNVLISNSTLLKVGDVIQFNSFLLKNYFKQEKWIFSSNYTLLSSLVEVDLYTGSIILLKDISMLHDYDLHVLIYENLDFNNFLNYIKY